MEQTLRRIMGSGLPPRFKFQDTFESIVFPTGYTVPTQAELETEYTAALVEEEANEDKTLTSGDLEVGTANLYVNTLTSKVGIGLNSPQYKLHVLGDIYASGNITAYSDVRKKENLQVIDKPLEKIQTLHGYTYEINDKKYTGLIAQELLKVLPEAVMGSDTDSYSVAYGNMAGIFVEAIKELNEKIKVLEEKISKM